MTDWSQWCRSQFDLIAVNGTWAVPRSGLVFQKVSLDPKVLRLVTRMPWDPAMLVTKAELVAQQDADFRQIQLEFRRAGISVEPRA